MSCERTFVALARSDSPNCPAPSELPAYELIGTQVVATLSPERAGGSSIRLRPPSRGDFRSADVVATLEAMAMGTSLWRRWR